MILSNRPKRSQTRWTRICVLLCAVVVLPLGLASAQDYDKVARRLKRSVKKGEITQQQADAMMGVLKRSGDIKKKGSQPAKKTDLEATWKKLEAMVKAGKLTEEQAHRKMAAVKKEAAKRDKVPASRLDRSGQYLMQMKKELGEAVKAGKISREEAAKRLKRAEAGIKKRRAMARQAQVKKGEDSDQAPDRGRQYLMQVRKKLGEAVEAGRISREEAGERYRAAEEGLKKRMAAARDQDGEHKGGQEQRRRRIAREDYARAEAEMRKAVADGQIAPARARARLQAMRKMMGDQDEHQPRREEGDRKVDLDAIAKRLRAAVKAGRMTEQEARAKWNEINKNAAGDKQGPSQGQAKDKLAAMQTLKYLALGCHLYAEDNDGMLPATLADLKPYIRESFDPDAYELVASGNLKNMRQPGKRHLIRAKKLFPGKQQAVAFVDGHVEITQVK